MFEKGDLVFEKKHPNRQGYICAVLTGKNSDGDYLEVQWLNFPWGNPHLRTLEFPKHMIILAKGNKNGNTS